MAPTLLNPWALDEKGKLVSAEHAHKGHYYTCPKCHEQLTPCKKGNGPHARRDHFKHKPDSSCDFYTAHAPESEIHKIAKQRVHDLLHSCIDRQMGFPMVWTCSDCGKDSNGDLLKMATAVETEKDLGVARPDVALTDREGKTIIAIEIVVTHDIEPETMQFYEQNGIAVIRLVVQSAEDCNDIEERLKHPDSVNLCFNRTCQRCQNTPMPRRIEPLKNKHGKYWAVAVGTFNPFADKPFIGLPFNEQDKHSANQFVKERWKNITLDYKVQEGIHYATFILQQSIQPRMVAPRRLNRYGTGLDEMVAKEERRKKAIRATYARMNKTKKSGGKRRR